MLIVVQVSVLGLYLAPPTEDPTQRIISSPVQTADRLEFRGGALFVLMGVQLLVLRLYLLPVFRTPVMLLKPPQTIISLSVQTDVWSLRAVGALTVLVSVQLSSRHGGEGVGVDLGPNRVRYSLELMNALTISAF